VKSAHARYEQSQLEQSKQKTTSEKDLKRKIITTEIEEVNKKRLRLQESVTDLVKDADSLSIDAEKKNDMKLLTRSNDLRKVAVAKKNEIRELDNMTKSLILRRDSII